MLPVITKDGYYTLHVSGEWFDAKTNITYDMKLCDQTDQEVVCILQTGHVNPCLTDSMVALCDWTHEPSRDMLWQVGPHTLCVATIHSHPVAFSTFCRVFAECISVALE